MSCSALNGRRGRLLRSAPQPCAVRYGAATRSMSAPAVACCRGGVQSSDICGRPVKSKTNSKDEALQCFRLMAQTTEGSSTLHCGGQNDGPGIVARGAAALRGMAKRTPHKISLDFPESKVAVYWWFSLKLLLLEVPKGKWLGHPT